MEIKKNYRVEQRLLLREKFLEIIRHHHLRQFRVLLRCLGNLIF